MPREAEDRQSVGPDAAADAGRLGSPFEALGVLAVQDVMLTARLRHLEMFTPSGLLTILWHEPTGSPAGPPVAVVAVGGAMGGLLGPGEGLYHQLGERLADRGVPMIRVSYRRPNDLDACCVDLAAAVQFAVASGAERVVAFGHSFGGAVAVRVAVAFPEFVTGVATFATQSAGCEVAGGLRGRPLLLFHGDRDELLPVQASEMVRAIAGRGELVILEGDGHLLARSGATIWRRLATWLPDTLGAEFDLGGYPVAPGASSGAASGGGAPAPDS